MRSPSGGEARCRGVTQVSKTPPSPEMTQGNRANRLCCDEAGEVVLVPCGNLSPEAYGVLAGRSARQVQRHVFDGGEVGWGVVGSDAAFVIAEDHVHDPVQAILDGPMASHDHGQ